MNSHENLMKYSKEELIELIDIYSKNWLAMDGVWFQSVEGKFGMDEAMFHDVEIWKKFTVIEAKKIKKFLGLEERPGLKGLEKALMLRFYANLNENFIEYDETGALIYTVTKCRVQHAREAKGMELHPCKPVGEVEYAGFAKTIDERIKTSCVSCYPDITDNTCSCKWRFYIED
ncbi:MAG: DUF6125 family protein [Clostridia bacterium]|nr:DUF6125 family protein [Clostridia bacterium]